MHGHMKNFEDLSEQGECDETRSKTETGLTCLYVVTLQKRVSNYKYWPIL